MTSMFEQRLQQYQTLLSAERIDGALITDPIIITYLFGYSSIIHVPSFRLGPIALIRADGSGTLLVPTSEAALMQKLGTHSKVQFFDGDQERWRMLGNLLDNSRISTLTVDMARISMAAMECVRACTQRNLSYLDMPAALLATRSIKDDWELEQIAGAATLASEALRAGIRQRAEAESEVALRSAMEHEIGTLAGSIAPAATVQATCNALIRRQLSDLHSLARATPLAADGIGFLLATVCVNGYWGDIARSLVESGSPPAAQAAFAVALEAQEAALRQVAPGALVREIVSCIDEVIVTRQPNAGRKYPVLRGLGLEKSERPSDQEPSHALRAGEVFCLQCYLVGDDFAVGRSDTVVVTASGHRLLTSDQS